MLNCGRHYFAEQKVEEGVVLKAEGFLANSHVCECKHEEQNNLFTSLSGAIKTTQYTKARACTSVSMVCGDKLFNYRLFHHPSNK